MAELKCPLTVQGKVARVSEVDPGIVERKADSINRRAGKQIQRRAERHCPGEQGEITA